jgi:bifunctional non-homologous end joining protein LigD
LINKSTIRNQQSAILRPMLASLADAPLADSQLVYEPKYDGIRAIVEIGTAGRVRLWSRLGNEKTHQFPEIAAALETWARVRKPPPELVLDGEIVALDQKGEPTGFQQLQGRIHLSQEFPKRGRESFSDSATRVTNAENDSRPLFPSGPRVAFIAFDILREGKTDLRDRPLLERRAILGRVFSISAAKGTGPGILRISEMVPGDGRALYKRALASGWEGLIAKQANSTYQSGKRTPDWRKLKIVHEQEFVIGGWTEPRHTRSYFGALLLGVYERGSLVYTGHTGTGFNERELARLMKLLKPIEIKECPFPERPHTNERPHWVQPKLVAQIKFTEWTADRKLRHPVYLGLRDDKQPANVVREPEVRLHAATSVRLKPDTTYETSKTKHDETEVVSGSSRTLIDQLRELEDARKDGVLALPDGNLKVTNLHKIFWPKQKLTKGDLFRYYVEIAPCILPAVADRPLVMKRYPNGVAAPPFYQHRADDVPKGVRVQTIGAAEKRQQIVGGSVTTLLYMTQLASISQDPWFSRVQSVQFADYVALDLDPSAGVTFDRVLGVARAIRDELEALGAVGVPKTSGADGLHIYIPLPPHTPYEAGLLFCQIIATVVSQKHPKIATVERSVRARGPRVYVDYLQNILGKTLATAYSARASDYAGVSTPLTWREVDRGVRREDFTIKTMPARLKRVGDVWATLRTSKGVDLSSVSRYMEPTRGKRTKKPHV